jgi:tetratricopeptide repeat protein
MRPESTLAVVLPLPQQNWTAERAGEIARVSATHRHDPIAQFGAGWMALKGGNPDAAEAAYRDVLRAWPGDDRALDNLGTALFQQGRPRDALESYQQAVEANSKNAVAFFNLGQAYLMGFEFDKANRAITTASALDFDRVREYQNQPARNGTLDPVPDWISPRRQWDALASPLAAGPLALPPNWQDRSETAPPNFSWVVLIVGIASVLLGRRLNRGLPLFRCINCDRVVCRRCAERRRAQAMCANCARVARGAASVGFATILLARERGRSTRLLRGARLALALAVPGAGLIPVWKVGGPFLLLLATAAVLTVPPGTVWPYAARARMNMTWDPWYLDVVVPLALIYTVSLWRYFAEQGRIARRNAEALRPGRMRPRVSTRVQEVESGKQAA